MEPTLEPTLVTVASPSDARRPTARPTSSIGQPTAGKAAALSFEEELAKAFDPTKEWGIVALTALGLVGLACVSGVIYGAFRYRKKNGDQQEEVPNVDLDIELEEVGIHTKATQHMEAHLYTQEDMNNARTLLMFEEE